MSFNETAHDATNAATNEPPRTGHPLPAWLLTMALGYSAIYGVLAIRKHMTFHSFVFDLGIMSQVLWNTAHGRLFELSLDRPENVALIGSYLGNHVRPVLLLLAPLYRMFPDPRLLLVLQPAFLASGAVPLYWIARRHLKNRLSVACVVLAYLLNPALGYLNLFDFHPIIIAIPMIFFAYWALITERNVLFWFSALLALSTKEEMAVPMAAFGVYCLFHRRWRRKGIALVTLSALWLGLCLMIVIPSFNEGQPYRFFRLWDVFSADEAPGAAAQGIWFLSRVDSASILTFLVHLFLPLGGLPLLAPGILAVAGPSLAYLLFSNKPVLHAIGYQYPAVLIPWLFLATVFGLEKIEGFFARTRSRLPAWTMVAPLLVGCAITSVAQSPIIFYWVGGAFRSADFHADITHALSLLPADAGVATVNSIGPHLTNRRVLVSVDKYPLERLEPHLEQVDYVLLDLVDCRAIEPPEQRKKYGDKVRRIIDTGDFGVLDWSGRILLLSRNSPRSDELGAVREVLGKMETEDTPCWP